MKIKDKIKKFKSATDYLISRYLVENIKNNIYKPVWDSSAQKLEQALKDHGIILPQKLYYEYKFPGGLKNFEFEEQNVLTSFCNIYENYFSSSAAGLQQQESLKKFMFNNYYFHYKRGKRTDLSAFFGFCICLALSDVEKLKSAFMIAQEQMYKLADLIKELNPELQNIENHRSVDFIAGAIYGFAPQEIQFFLNLQERRKARDFDYQYEKDGKDEELKHTKLNMQKISAFINNDIDYFLAPETSDNIIKAINENLMFIQNQNYKE